MLLLQVADVVTSNAVMTTHIDARELNPVMRNAMDNFGTLWWTPKAVLGAFVVLLASMLRGVSRPTMAAAIAVTSGYIAVVLNNLTCL